MPALAAPPLRPPTARESLTYMVDRCSLGLVLVAESERGVCAITLGDHEDAVVQELQAAFPTGTLRREPLAAMPLVRTLIEAPSTRVSLPLDVRGTPFQRRVWSALQHIPPGRTVTYAQLAESIGAPRAVRAVAGACAANRLAVVIPCHRVIRGSGALAGFRWGIERKSALLAREAAPTPA